MTTSRNSTRQFLDIDSLDHRVILRCGRVGLQMVQFFHFSYSWKQTGAPEGGWSRPRVLCAPR